ncbi:MAG: hypothetical protein GY883_03775 [Shimia sp.]|nr:hypothetical protein [Shimia sp.]
MFQARKVDVLEPQRFLLSERLRGQFGSEVPESFHWPVGSWFVALNGQIPQLSLASALRNVARHYRIGAASRALSDTSYSHHVHAFSGIGLRPYAPVHLRAEADDEGGLRVAWVRRTRIDGDSWNASEPPLGEEVERYSVRVRRGAQILRQADVTTAEWHYSSAQQAVDGIAAGDVLEVAQVSARFGAGKYAKLIL